MFGRIRASPSPIEWLEMERPPSKLFKDDSLSVYEATIMKLKQGSQRSVSSEHDSSLTLQDPMDYESNGSVSVSEESSKVTSSCSEQGTPNCSGSDSSYAGSSASPHQEPKKGREVSIQFLFSRYSSSHQKQGLSSPCCSNEIVERCSSANSTASVSDSESIRF